MANLTHDAHPIPLEIESAIADYGDGVAESADATLGTPEWQNAMAKKDTAWATLKVAIAELARDKERLDAFQAFLDGRGGFEGTMPDGRIFAFQGSLGMRAPTGWNRPLYAPTYREMLDVVCDLRATSGPSSERR